MNSKPGTNKLAQTIVDRMRKENVSSPISDFGEIKENKSLVTDQFPVPIPKSEYVVLKTVGKISPGDRVLVIWVQNDAVIVGVL